MNHGDAEGAEPTVRDAERLFVAEKCGVIFGHGPGQPDINERIDERKMSGLVHVMGKVGVFNTETRGAQRKVIRILGSLSHREAAHCLRGEKYVSTHLLRNACYYRKGSHSPE